MSVSDVNSHFVISIYCKALKISGLGSTLESMIDFLIQAWRRLGSDSVVVTQTCWIAEESLSATCTWPASPLHIRFTNADRTDPMYLNSLMLSKP